jgi:hypothetical protein
LHRSLVDVVHRSGDLRDPGRLLLAACRHLHRRQCRRWRFSLLTPHKMLV